MTEDKMVGWHHQLNAHESEQTPGDSEEQGSLAYCSPWGHRVRHDLATKQQQTMKKHCVLHYNNISCPGPKILHFFKTKQTSGVLKEQNNPKTNTIFF